MLEVKYLKELDNLLKKNNILKSDICIVGSAVMAAYNLRENKDLDIIVLHEVREKIKNTNRGFSLSKNIECVSKNWMLKFDKITTDKMIITDPSLHFIDNQGFKYCTLELLIKRKRFSMRKKDKKDLIIINDRS